MAERATVPCLAGKGKPRLNAKFLDELAVVAIGGSLGGAGDHQHSQAASWIDVDDEQVAAWQEAGLSETQRGLLPIFTIGTAGVAEADASISLTSTYPTFEATVEGFRLATQTCKPHADLRLTLANLETPEAGTDVAAKWATRKEGETYQAVGEIRGAFGGGIDRFVVVRPKQYWFEREDKDGVVPEPTAEDHCATEFAIAMKGSAVVGAIPFGRLPGSRAKCVSAENGHLSKSGLELIGRVDLDRDGTDELLWVYEESRMPVTTSVVLTTHMGGKLGAKVLSSYGYASCDAYIDPSKCGRAPTKANHHKPHGR